MKKIILSFLILIPYLTYSQSLGKERIERLNKSVVRILIDTIPSGTGFFVNDKGWVATCEHVIKRAYVFDSITNKLKSLKKIYIEFQNGEKVEMGVKTTLLNNGYKKASIYDYSLLKVETTPKTDYKSLKIGNWTDIEEGDIVYSCGYPLGIKQRFISQGLLSTKWTDSIPWRENNKVIDTTSRNIAWLDLTMNKGNSGGAIIKLGKTPDEDKVIGIASFILNPYANTSEQIAKYLPKRGVDMVSNGISQNQLLQILFEAVSNNSIGVSGCISIDYVSDVLKTMYP